MAAVSIAPEVIFNINGLKVTNSILATLLVDFVLISIIYKIRADLSPVPGFGTIGFFQEEHGKEVFIPILRAVTSDFNATFALAIISLVATHILSIKYNGIFSYLKRFFSLNPIFLFVGILELVSEVTKVISLSFRLFGNIYAGEVVLHTISSLFAFVAPIPFLLLESIVALVQALVFSMLTMVFMTILITPHSEGGEH